MALWFAACVSSARAEEPAPSTGHILACDTADEVEAVLNSGAGDIDARIAKINDRFGKQSCNVVTAMFYRGDEAKTVLVHDGVVRIIKVDVVGVRAGDTWMRMSRPVQQFVGVLEKALDV